MTVVAHEDLQSLAGFETDEPCAISVYLNLDRSVSPTPADIQPRISALVTEGRRRQPENASHEGRVAYDAALQRIEQALTDNAHSRGNGRRIQGLAAFASGRDRLEVRSLPVAVEDRLCVGTRFFLGPLAAAAARPNELLVLIVSREQGRLLRYSAGELQELFDDFERAERRHDQGGWEQKDLQRWHDQAALDHVRRVVDHFERLHAELGRPPVVLSADDEAAKAVQAAMGQEASAALAERVGNERDRTNRDLIEQAEATLERLAREKEEKLFARWDEGRRRGGGGTASPAETLAAISDARVEWLLVGPSAEAQVYRCVQCGRLYANAGQCDFDSAPLRLAREGIEAAVAKAIGFGGSVWRQIDPDREDLAPAGGYAAINRF